MLHLSRLDASSGKVYQLADPNPLSVDQLVSRMSIAAHRSVIRVPLPMRLAKFSIEHVPGVYRVMQIPSPAIDYFVHPTLYDCSNTLTDLEGSGLSAPPSVTASIAWSNSYGDIQRSATNRWLESAWVTTRFSYSRRAE